LLDEYINAGKCPDCWVVQKLNTHAVTLLMR
jgi:hypothetical protein